MKSYLELTKFGIVVFVLLTGAAGYFLSYRTTAPFSFLHFSLSLLALYFLSSGSFVFNQLQEKNLDALMNRTANRPLPSGRVSVLYARWIGGGLIVAGVALSFTVNFLVGILGLISILLYNGFYTLIWKRKWAYGAIPGALPGAMPVLIGYAANSWNLLDPEILYSFFVMFLWQMPHYWALAIRYKDDYEQAGVPVLPVVRGFAKTLDIMGIYTLAYIGLVVLAPFFIPVFYAYVLFALPVAAWVVWEFIKYYRSQDQRKWFPFFMWTTASVLVFLITPVIDRWLLQVLP